MSYTLPPNNAIRAIVMDPTQTAQRAAYNRDLKLQLENFLNSQSVQPIKGAPGRNPHR
jgi:hypothetical protein